MRDFFLGMIGLGISLWIRQPSGADPHPGSDLLLEDNSSVLLLEDNISSLNLES